MNTRKMRNTKGITLVALIVTIIVLLILAGISLNLILGEKGITQRAVNAGKVHNISGAKEKLELQIADYAGEYYQAKYVNRSVDANDVGTYVLGKFSPEETTFEENYYLKKENSKLILTSSDRTTTATCTVDSNGKVEWEGTEIDDDSLQTTYTWTQYAEEGETAKIWVTNGDVTLEVGSSVTGYSVTVNETTYGDGNWYVLGAKDGKLLITMNTNPEEVTLEGKSGYINGITTLNTASAKYADSTYASGNARSIDVDDINRVTGYDPTTYGTGSIEEYGNEVTFIKKIDNRIWYQGSKYPLTETSSISSVTSFEYWNGTNWIILGEEESATIKNTYYEYSAENNGISTDSDAYTLLFANTNPWDYAPDGKYWLNSPVVMVRDGGWVCFGLRDVDLGRVLFNFISFDSLGRTSSPICGLRPVVSLKSTIKVTSTGVISNN